MRKLLALTVIGALVPITALAQSAERSEPKETQDKVVAICRDFYPNTTYVKSTVSTYVSNGEASATINCYYQIPKK